MAEFDVVDLSDQAAYKVILANQADLAEMLLMLAWRIPGGDDGTAPIKDIEYLQHRISGRTR